MKKNKMTGNGKRGCIACLLLTAVVVGGCTSDATDSGNQTGTYDPTRGLFVVDNDTTAYDSNDFSTDLTDTEKKIGSDMNEYAVGMLMDYSSAGSSRENTLLSPMSASLLYAMMANFTSGANTDYEPNNQYKKNLGLDSYKMSDVNSYSRKIAYRDKKAGEEGCNISNSVFISQKKPVYSSFLSMANSYGVKVQGTDFDSPQASDHISGSLDNDSQEKPTDGHTDNLSLTKDMESVVTTSMSLSKRWAMSMGVDSTSAILFTNADGSTTPCTVLYNRGKMNYAHFDYFDLLELGYDDGDYAMYVVLPHSAALLPQSLAYIQGRGLANCIDALGLKQIDLKLPRFSYSTTTGLNKEQGTVAQMYQSSLPKVSPNGFKLGNIYQACSIELSQRGLFATVKTTGTVIVIDNSYAGATPGKIEEMQYVNFHALHPFAVFIRSRKLSVVPYACCIMDLRQTRH